MVKGGVVRRYDGTANSCVRGCKLRRDGERNYLGLTSAYCSSPTYPPRIDVRTFCANRERFSRRSLAASVQGREMVSIGLACERGWRRQSGQWLGGCGGEPVKEKYDEGSREVGTGGERERTLIQRIVGVGLEEEVLQSDHDGIEVEDGLPVLAQDVQAHVSFEVEVRVVDLRVRVRAGERWWRLRGKAGRRGKAVTGEEGDAMDVLSGG